MTWWIVLVCDLLIPAIMLGFGVMMIKKAPKDINFLFGYRTNRSMKNQDTWDFAHKHCGRIWCITGIITLVVTAFIHIPFYSSDESVIEKVAVLVTVLQLVVLIASIIPTELALKKTFNDDGTRK